MDHETERDRYASNRFSLCLKIYKECLFLRIQRHYFYKPFQLCNNLFNLILIF